MSASESPNPKSNEPTMSRREAGKAALALAATGVGALVVAGHFLGGERDEAKPKEGQDIKDVEERVAQIRTRLHKFLDEPVSPEEKLLRLRTYITALRQQLETLQNQPESPNQLKATANVQALLEEVLLTQKILEEKIEQNPNEVRQSERVI